MAEMHSEHVYLPFTKLVQSSLSKKYGKITYFLQRFQIVWQKGFGQPPLDALVKIEITLASTDNVARP